MERIVFMADAAGIGGAVSVLFLCVRRWLHFSLCAKTWRLGLSRFISSSYRMGWMAGCIIVGRIGWHGGVVSSFIFLIASLTLSISSLNHSFTYRSKDRWQNGHGRGGARNNSCSFLCARKNPCHFPSPSMPRSFVFYVRKTPPV